MFISYLSQAKWTQEKVNTSGLLTHGDSWCAQSCLVGSWGFSIATKYVGFPWHCTRVWFPEIAKSTNFSPVPGSFVPSAALRQAPDVSVALPVQFCTQNCSASAAEKWLNTNTYFPRHRAGLKQLHLIKGPPKWIDPILNQGFRVGYSGVSRITYNIYQYLTITEILQTTWR